MKTTAEKRDQQREYFKNHVAQYWDLSREGAPSVEMIRFQEPGTNNYFIEFLFTNGTLFVRGDLGEATYCWHYSMGLKSLGGISMDYMSGKCQASEVGKDFKQWDSEEAKESLLEHLTEYTDEADVHEHLEEIGIPYDDADINEYTDSRIEKEKAVLAERKLKEILELCVISSENEWVGDINNLKDPGETFNDNDFWEWAYAIGKVPNTRLIIHHLAITLAIQQLIENGVVITS